MSTTKQNVPVANFPNIIRNFGQGDNQENSWKTYSFPHDVLVTVLRHSDLETIATCMDVSPLFRQAALEIFHGFRSVGLVEMLRRYGVRPPSPEIASSMLNRFSNMKVVSFNASDPSQNLSLVIQSSHIFCRTRCQPDLRDVFFIGIPLNDSLFIPFIENCETIMSVVLAQHDSINDELFDAVVKYCSRFFRTHGRPRFRTMKLLSAPVVTLRGFQSWAFSYISMNFLIEKCASVRVAQVGLGDRAPQKMASEGFPGSLILDDLRYLRLVVARPCRNFGDIQEIHCFECPTLSEICLETQGCTEALKTITIRNCLLLKSFRIRKVETSIVGPSHTITPLTLFSDLEVLSFNGCPVLSAEVFNNVFGIGSGAANVLPKLKHLRLSATLVKTVNLQLLTELESVELFFCPELTNISISGCAKLKNIYVHHTPLLREAHLLVNRYCRIVSAKIAWRSDVFPCGKLVCLTYRW